MNLEIAKPITLPCGLRLPNRLAKAAMTEQMAEGKHLPGEAFHRAYGSWADGDWGMVLTGHVIVDINHLGAPRDTAVDPSIAPEMEESWRKWVKAARGGDSESPGPPLIMQINHPGRQAPAGVGKRGFFAKTLAPSPVGLHFGDGYIARAICALMFGTPAEMTVAQIKTLVQQFVDTASTAARTGFSGVQIHAAHGYLLAQFLSEDINQRNDQYGGTPEKRARIVVEIIKAIREVVPSSFCVGVKLNSVDHQSSTKLQGCISQLKLMADAGIDFLEISGGTYENPTMAAHSTSDVEDNSSDDQKVDNPKCARTAAREAFFLEFSKAIRSSLPNVPLMVTGGFRTRQGMEAAVAENACDLVGIGRPAVLNPLLPRMTVFNKEVAEQDARLYARKIETPWLSSILGLKQVGSGAENVWYSNQISKIGG